MAIEPRHIDFGPFFPRAFAFFFLTMLFLAFSPLLGLAWKHAGWEGIVSVFGLLYLPLFLVLWLPRAGGIEISRDRNHIRFYANGITGPKRAELAVSTVSEVLFKKELSYGFPDHYSISAQFRDGTVRELFSNIRYLSQGLGPNIAKELRDISGLPVRAIVIDHADGQSKESEWLPTASTPRVGIAVAAAVIPWIGLAVPIFTTKARPIVELGVTLWLVSLALYWVAAQSKAGEERRSKWWLVYYGYRFPLWYAIALVLGMAVMHINTR